MVQRMASLVDDMDSVVLAIAPEGTRKAVHKWKTGFYHIAAQADVPIVLASIDHARKTVLLGPIFERTGDVTADLQAIQLHYEQIGRTKAVGE
jgi:1-acyl-sn-glycerol-3-phosphate acyltransferase